MFKNGYQYGSEISDDLSQMLPIQYHLQRQLAVFEECAAIQDRTKREACCDKNVEDEGGRDFCYKELKPDKEKF